MKHGVRVAERVDWLLRQMVIDHPGGMVAWDEEIVDAFVEDFPEAEKSLRVYTLGPNSSPMLNRTAGLARRLGYLWPGSIGNQDARSLNQRTWCRYWSLTPAGCQRLREIAPELVQTYCRQRTPCTPFNPEDKL